MTKRKGCVKALLSHCALPVLIMFCFFSPVKAQDDFYNQVAEIRISFAQENWDEVLDSLFENFGEDGRLEADVTVNGHLFKGAGVRYKGYSSWDPAQSKNPFNIDLDYHIKNANYQGHTKLKLSNVISDPSFVREVLSYEIAAKYMPVSRAFYANVYVNDVLLGLYNNVEAVDEFLMARYFPLPKNILIKGNPVALQYPFGQNSNLAYTHGTDSSGYIPFYKLQTEYGWNALFNFINILNNDTANLKNVLNIDRALWMHAFNYALVNLDSYIGYSQNYYMFVDENNRFNTILWDLNMSFGSFRNTDGTALNLTVDKAKKLNPLQHLYSPAFSPRPLMKQLFLNDTYRKMYLAHLRTIVNENFATGWYYTRAQELRAEIDDDVLNDTNRFYGYDDFVANLDSEVVVGSNRFPGIKDLVDGRMAYLQTYSGYTGEPTIAAAVPSPEHPLNDEMVCFQVNVSKATKVRFFYRNCKYDVFSDTLMFDDGLHQDGAAGDSLFGICLQTTGKTMQYYFWAENDSAGIFSPERAQYEFYTLYPKISAGDVVINEVFAPTDSTGWIELFNNSDADLSLAGLSLKVTSETGFVYENFPDTVISSGGFYVANISGHRSSSQLSLEYSATNVLDELTPMFAGTSRSQGKYPNGTGDISVLTPTKASWNKPGQAINEELLVYPNPAGEIVFIECNQQDSPVTIEIVSGNGNVVFKQQVTDESCPNPSVIISVNIGDYSPGAYMVRLIGRNEVKCKKLMIY